MTLILPFATSTAVELRIGTLRHRRHHCFEIGTSTSHGIQSGSSEQQPSATTPEVPPAMSAILSDPDAARKLFEFILQDSPTGKRSLSRLARTSKALSDIVLDVLWRELDSLIPIIGLFPAQLLRRTKKPGMGLVRAPAEGDWKQIVHYSARVQRITYDESANNIATSIFPHLQQSRPGTYILPQLTHLTWKAETPAGLDRCHMFLNPNLQGISLQAGAKFPGLESLLGDISSQTKLTSFQFVSPMALPDRFTEILHNQRLLEKLVLVAPGALSPRMGRWIASLDLSALQLDLSQRSLIAVEGFFDDLGPRSGDSTPSSVGNSTDSGVFSGEELDFSDIRKSALRLTGDMETKGSFKKLKRLHLTGESSNIAVFLKHLASPLSQLELVIEDPPDKLSWQDLTLVIGEKFRDALQTLRVSATASSRYSVLIRTTSRGDLVENSHLSFEHLTPLPYLTTLELDLPESIVFLEEDIINIAASCPNLEVLRLCPLARFIASAGAPRLTLEAIAPLTTGCRRLHTLSIVLNAKAGSKNILESREASSASLQRLHVGYSWASDPLEVTILLSHLAPRLDNLKWFLEKNRLGYVEAHAKNWAMINEGLPHLQKLRLWEQSQVRTIEPKRPETVDKGIGTQQVMIEQGIQVMPETAETSAQASVPESLEKAVDATKIVGKALTTYSESYAQVSSGSVVTEAKQTLDSIGDVEFSDYSVLPYVFDIIGFTARLLIYPMYFSMHLIHISLARFHESRQQPDSDSTDSTAVTVEGEKPLLEDSNAVDTKQVRE